MAEKILTAINWNMTIMGDGEIVVSEKPTEPAVQFDAVGNDVVEPQITYRRDWFKCPNVLRATADDLTAIARDDSPDSPLSTVNRGREVWFEDSDATLNTGEGIAEYARRRLKEEQAIAVEVSYSRRYFPDLHVGDIVRLHYPAQNIDGNYRITSQNIELSHGARTSEEVTQA